MSHVTCCIQTDTYPTFQELVEQVVHNLDGAYALVFKSSLFPGEVVAARLCVCAYACVHVCIHVSVCATVCCTVCVCMHMYCVCVSCDYSINYHIKQ